MTFVRYNEDAVVDPYAPLEFPEISIFSSSIRLAPVSFFDGIIDSDGDRKEIRVMQTPSGICYAWSMEGAGIECIFGEVLTGYALISTRTRAANDLPIFHCGEKRVMKKFLKTKIDLHARKGSIESWEQELKALEFIGDQHPHIMGNIETCCDSEGNVYSIMRYANGDDLFNIIRPGGAEERPTPLPEHEARRMLLHVMKGLKHLHHELGIAHQDISPENILCNIPSEGAEPIYMLHDMGQCRRIPTNTQVSTGASFVRKQAVMHRRRLLGKTHYRAPELWEEAPLNSDELDLYMPEAADIWSLGCLLFCSLTGAPAIKYATTADGRYNAIVAGKLDMLVEHWKMQDLISPTAVDIIQSMLRADPVERITLDALFDHPWMKEGGSTDE